MPKRSKKKNNVLPGGDHWMNWMEAEESPSGRNTGVRGNTLALRLAKAMAGSLDNDGETLGVDPKALDFFFKEEARAVAA